MKTLFSLRFIASLIAILTFILIMKSCKKMNNYKNVNNPKTEKEIVVDSIRAKYGNVAAGIMFPVHRGAEVFYRGDNGNMLSLYSNNSGNGHSFQPNGPC